MRSFPFPSGFIIERIGYQWMMVAGLLTMGLGALLFVPAASAPSFPLFLAALIILAAGITALQVSANPYVALLGPARTASSRLTLTQAFNSFGTFIAPVFGGSPDSRHCSQDRGGDRGDESRRRCTPTVSSRRRR